MSKTFSFSMAIMNQQSSFSLSHCRHGLGKFLRTKYWGECLMESSMVLSVSFSISHYLLLHCVLHHISMHLHQKQLRSSKLKPERWPFIILFIHHLFLFWNLHKMFIHVNATCIFDRPWLNTIGIYIVNPGH